MLRCGQLHLTDEMLESMTIGMIYDMLIEKANDYYDYPIKANQQDIDNLLG